MDEREQSLAMMIRRLVSSLKRHEPDSRTAAQAVDLLKRYGLLGSPLRATCRDGGRCQYAIGAGAEGLGACPPGKCVVAQQEGRTDE